MPSDEELEEYWEALRPKPLIQVVSDRPSELSDILDLVCEQTIHNVRNSLEMYLRPLTEQDHRMVEEIVARALRSLKTNWLKELEDKDLSGLIEFILQGQSLKPSEMREFLHALPRSLLARICDSTLHTATGIHALMGVEVARRDHIISDYRIVQDKRRIRVTFTPSTGEVVVFHLDESFELIEDRLQCLDDLRDENYVPF